jgi:hypothetical protein
LGVMIGMIIDRNIQKAIIDHSTSTTPQSKMTGKQPRYKR